MTIAFQKISDRIELQGNIIHTVVLEGVQKAIEQYPKEVDWILDFMNTEGYKQLQYVKK